MDRQLEELVSGVLLGIALLAIAALSLCDTKTQLECGRSGATAFEIAYKAMQTMIAAERLSDQFLAKQTG